MNNLRNRCTVSVWNISRIEDKRQIRLIEHEKILRALRNRHVAEAKAAVREHIDNQEITVLKNIKEQEE